MPQRRERFHPGRASRLDTFRRAEDQGRFMYRAYAIAASGRAFWYATRHLASRPAFAPAQPWLSGDRFALRSTWPSYAGGSRRASSRTIDFDRAPASRRSLRGTRRLGLKRLASPPRLSDPFPAVSGSMWWGRGRVWWFRRGGQRSLQINEVQVKELCATRTPDDLMPGNFEPGCIGRAAHRLAESGPEQRIVASRPRLLSVFEWLGLSRLRPGDR